MDRQRSLVQRLAICLALIPTFIAGYRPINGLAGGSPTATRTPNPIGRTQRITATNLDRIALLRRLGQGSVEQLAWSPCGNTLAVSGSSAVWLYATHFPP